VITGAACSGKTTLIDLLADKGFQTDAVQMITDCMEHGYLAIP
jgi:predicted ATPase